MERERQVCFVGCWLLGAVIGFFVGAAVCMDAMLFWMTSAQRDFSYAASVGLAVSPLGGWALWWRQGG